MSTVKVLNCQIGQSLTASQNFVWYQPSSPDGTVRLGNGNAGSVTDLVTINSSGNVGIGTSSTSGMLLNIGGTTGASTNSMIGLSYTNTSSQLRLTWNNAGAAIIGIGGDSSGNIILGTSASLLGTSPTALATLTQSGNLGLGVTPSGWASSEAIQLGSSGATNFGYSKRGVAQNSYYDGSSWRYYTTGLASLYQPGAGTHIFYSAASGSAGAALSWTQAMTLDASGALSNVSYIKGGTYIWAAGDTSSGGIYLGSAGAGNARIGQNSYGSGTTTTYIGNAAITTSSDVRLKENIQNTKRNAIEIIENLRVVDHTWNDPTDTCENNRNSRGVWMGLIAQEAINHIPWLVNKPLADEDENGDPQYWHMDYGYAVPLLVKAIQELSAELNELKAKVK